MDSPAVPASMQIIIIGEQNTEIKPFISQRFGFAKIDNFLQGGGGAEERRSWDESALKHEMSKKRDGGAEVELFCILSMHLPISLIS